MKAGSVGDSRSGRIQRLNPVAPLRYVPGLHSNKGTSKNRFFASFAPSLRPLRLK